MPITQFSLAVVGADYPNKRGPGRRFEIQICRPGEVIELRPEPKNRFDERAVAVFSLRGVQIGYLTAERAPWIVAMINSGRTVSAIFQAPTGFGAIIRAAIDGEIPILPPEKQERPPDGDDGFWPDPIPPDE